MRSRFFFILFLVLLIVSSATVYLHSVFVRLERFSFLDQEVRNTALPLIDSEVFELRRVNFETIDAIISEEIGESRIGKFFVVRNQKGEILYQSGSAQILGLSKVPQDPQWITLNQRGKYIRVLNLKLPKFPDRTLQVGAIVDEQIADPPFFSESSLMLFSSLLGIGLMVSYLLTSFLLQPLSNLARFLRRVSSQLKTNLSLPEFTDSSSVKILSQSKDEFADMVVALNQLVEKINRQNKISRLWASQMAHELKTPLARLQVQVEKSNPERESTREEIRKISEIINSFLAWAELEHTSADQNLYALNLSEIVKNTVQESEQGHRFQLKLNPLVVVAHPTHLQTFVVNLIRNALVHTEGPIEVQILGQTLQIKDQGLGLSESVLGRLGQPFNRNSSATEHGHGLGLAWVVSICKLYDWKYEFTNRQEGGLEIQIQFPPE